MAAVAVVRCAVRWLPRGGGEERGRGREACPGPGGLGLSRRRAKPHGVPSRPRRAGAPQPATKAGLVGPACDDAAARLRAEVERLTRENKTLQMENQNVYWLAEEVKRLRAEARAVAEQQGRG